MLCPPKHVVPCINYRNHDVQFHLLQQTYLHCPPDVGTAPAIPQYYILSPPLYLTLPVQQRDDILPLLCQFHYLKVGQVILNKPEDSTSPTFRECVRTFLGSSRDRRPVQRLQGACTQPWLCPRPGRSRSPAQSSSC